MYYHSRNIRYVVYDKVYPAPIDSLDEIYKGAYQWLGIYCGFFPQIWLSRSKSSITGYKAKYKSKGTSYRGQRLNKEPEIMFAFDIIKGFSVDYEIWCFILNALINCKDPIKNGNKAISDSLNEYVNTILEMKEDPTKDEYISSWVTHKDINRFLKEKLFIENDQVVLPSINLKVAKTIYCRDEHQVKRLRNMGFIKDRIKILNCKCWD